MKLHDGLPEILKAAIFGHEYKKTPGRYSVTELVNPPLISALKRVHTGIKIDPEDRIFAFMGSGVHLAIEEAFNEFGANLDGHRIIELEGFVKCDLDGYEIVGRYDCIEETPDGEIRLWDWKTAKAGMYRILRRQGDKPEWKKQLQIYAAILTEFYGRVIDRIAVGVLFKDYSKMQRERVRDYPPSGAIWLEWEFSSDEVPEILDWVVSRIGEIEMNIHALENGNVPPVICSPDERYEEPAFAVMREGRKTAIRRFHNQGQAEEEMYRLGKGHYVEQRPIMWNRCRHYCDVADVCPVYQEAMKATLDKPVRVAEYG